MPATATTNYKQAINLIDKMNQIEKEKLADYINEITMSQWFNNFRKRMKDIPVSFEEITESAEEVRNGRYESSH